MEERNKKAKIILKVGEIKEEDYKNLLKEYGDFVERASDKEIVMDVSKEKLDSLIEKLEKLAIKSYKIEIKEKDIKHFLNPNLNDYPFENFLRKLNKFFSKLRSILFKPYVYIPIGTISLIFAGLLCYNANRKDNLESLFYIPKKEILGVVESAKQPQIVYAEIKEGENATIAVKRALKKYFKKEIPPHIVGYILQKIPRSSFRSGNINLVYKGERFPIEISKNLEEKIKNLRIDENIRNIVKKPNRRVEKEKRRPYIDLERRMENPPSYAFLR